MGEFPKLGTPSSEPKGRRQPFKKVLKRGPNLENDLHIVDILALKHFTLPEKDTDFILSGYMDPWGFELRSNPVLIP